MKFLLFMRTLLAQCRRLVYAKLLASFCFDFPITLQAVESYFVCFCIIKS